MDERASSLIPVDERYSGLDVSLALRGESLLQTMERVQEAWTEAVAPLLDEGQHVLMVGHGNALRALVGIIENLDGDRVANLEISNGTPVIYELDGELKALSKTVIDAGPRTPSEIL
ncbi:bisphosphoglycerate-dependent phosphoglycerate mutase family 1 [Variovorax sp. Sphag1AA]|nr:bisphosphoglycerate-dependent phosphoglycerate mutase family 1 [Variovorax sp. Sphag1AA]